MGIRPGKAKGPSVAPASGGGGGGNVLGTFTATHLPVASAIHTLIDSPLTYDAGTNTLTMPADVTIGGITLIHTTGLATMTLLHSTGQANLDGAVIVGGDLSVGANILLEHATGQIDCSFLHVTSDTAIDGVLRLAGNLLVNTNKFMVDAATGNTVVAGTTDLKDQVTFEKSTVLGIVVVNPVGSPPTLTLDAYQSDIFQVSPGAGTTTLEPPLNPAAGRRFILRIHPTGGGTDITFDPIFVFPGGAPAIDWNSSGYFYLGFMWNEHHSTWDNIGPLQGPF